MTPQDLRTVATQLEAVTHDDIDAADRLVMLTAALRLHQAAAEIEAVDQERRYIPGRYAHEDAQVQP